MIYHINEPLLHNCIFYCRYITC